MAVWIYNGVMLNVFGLQDAGEVSATTGRGIKCMVLGYEVIVGSLNFLREEDVEHSHNSTFANMAIAAQESGSIVIFVAINGSMRAMFQLADKPRPEAAATVAALRAMGKKVWIVTGDNIRTATSLGASLGIPPSNIVSEALPSTKIQHVKQLQADGEFVAFVGDGINDAPAGKPCCMYPHVMFQMTDDDVTLALIGFM
jgi:P-type E1-E2 ATPase